MPFKRQFKDKYAASSRERICCPNSVRLVTNFSLICYFVFFLFFVFCCIFLGKGLFLFFSFSFLHFSFLLFYSFFFLFLMWEMLEPFFASILGAEKGSWKHFGLKTQFIFVLAPQRPATMVENRKKHRKNSHPMIHCPMSEGMSEVNERANE